MSGEPRETLWLKQCLQFDILRGNSSSVVTAGGFHFKERLSSPSFASRFLVFFSFLFFLFILYLPTVFCESVTFSAFNESFTSFFWNWTSDGCWRTDQLMTINRCDDAADNKWNNSVSGLSLHEFCANVSYFSCNLLIKLYMYIALQWSFISCQFPKRFSRFTCWFIV